MAEIKDTGLPSGSTPTGSDIYTGVQSGGSVRWTHSQLLNYIRSDISELIDDANSPTYSGVFKVSGGCVNTPAGAALAGSLILSLVWDSNAATQIYYENNSLTKYQRNKSSGVWGNWGYIDSAQVSALDSWRYPGLHSVASGATGVPVGVSTAGSTFLHVEFDSNAAHQVYFEFVNGNTYKRMKAGGVWSSWVYESDSAVMYTDIPNSSFNIGFSAHQGHKLAVNGTTANTTGVWATISDEDLKNIIGPVTGNLEKVKQLKECLIHYELKEGVGSGDEGYRTGYSAHKLKAAFPGHVKEVTPTPAEGKYLGWEYETIPAEYDKYGNETKPEEIKTVKEGRKKLVVENNFDVYAIGAVAELSEIVENQQATIDALTKRLDVLEGK